MEACARPAPAASQRSEAAPRTNAPERLGVAPQVPVEGAEAGLPQGEIRAPKKILWPVLNPVERHQNYHKNGINYFYPQGYDGSGRQSTTLTVFVFELIS